MTPERLYTLPELARITGRSYDFWDRQCRHRRLHYRQHELNGTRLISESDYAEWLEAGKTSTRSESALATAGATVPAWVDF